MGQNDTKDSKWLITFLLIVGVILVTCSFAAPLILTQTAPNEDFVFNSATGVIGDTIGGLMNPFIALAGVIMTTLAFYMQYRANEIQRDLFEKQLKIDKETLSEEINRNQKEFTTQISHQQKQFEEQQFEARFVTMIDLHRKNVEELNYTTKETKKHNPNEIIEVKSYGRKVFKIIDHDFKLLFHELAHFFNNKNEKQIYLAEYLTELKSNPNFAGRTIDLITYAKIDMVYSILFLGLSAQDRSSLINIFKNRYEEDFYTRLIAYAALKPKKESNRWEIWKNAYDNYIKDFRNDFDRLFTLNRQQILSENGYLNFSNQFYKGLEKFVVFQEAFDKYYGGHQFRLGHYYRHLIQIVNYINDNKEYSYEKKMGYIRLLRAQLSTFEQNILFLDTVSVFGRIWELEVVGDSTKLIETNKKLITKYNLIKNIPNGKLVDGEILMSDFYPDVTLEMNFSERGWRRRKELEKEYDKNANRIYVVRPIGLLKRSDKNQDK